MGHWVRYYVLLILAILIASSSYLSWTSDQAMGKLTVQDFEIVRENGRSVTFSVYKARQFTYGKPMPVILTVHGISASREAMDAYTIELARRNFTVVAIDLPGHGVSAETFGLDTFTEGVYDAYAAVRYVQVNDTQADDTVYGVLGHSLGAGLARLFQNMPVRPASTVLIGGGMGQDFGALLPAINETSPANLLIASGVYDELIPPAVAYDTLRDATGLSEVNAGHTYGNFTLGTARKLVFSSTNHLFEMSDPTIVSSSVDWLVRSLHGEEALNHTLDSGDRIYHLKGIATTVGATSVALSLFPVFVITYALFPVRLRPSRYSSTHPQSGSGRTLLISLLISALSGVVLLTVTLVGFGLDFAGLGLVPVSFGSTLILYSVIMSVAVTLILRKSLGSDAISIPRSLASPTGLKALGLELIKTGLLMVPVFLWLALWSWLPSLLGARFVLSVIFVGGGASTRTLTAIVLTVAFLPLFFVESRWIRLTADTDRGWKTPLELVKLTGLVLVHRMGGILILLAALYGPFLLGVQMGFVMFIALLMLVFVLVIGLTALLTLWMGVIARNDLVPALLNALLLAVVVAGTFQII